MGTFGSRRGFAEKLSLPLMIVAFLVVAGFLYWLNITAEPTEPVAVKEETDRGPGVSAILDVDDFLADVARLEGQTVEVTDVRVTSRLGPQAFWIGPDDRPFLVKLDPSALEAGVSVSSGQVLSVIGTVLMMTDSVLVAWGDAGAFPTEGDRIVAEFAVGSLFLEASRALTGGGGGSGSGDGSGS
jgi:hypothetical protein